MADAGGWARRVLAGRPSWMAHVIAGEETVRVGGGAARVAGWRAGVTQVDERGAEGAESVGESGISATMGVGEAPARSARVAGRVSEEGAARARVAGEAPGRWAERTGRVMALGAEATGAGTSRPSRTGRAVNSRIVGSAETTEQGNSQREQCMAFRTERERAREERRMRVAMSR